MLAAGLWIIWPQKLLTVHFLFSFPEEAGSSVLCGQRQEDPADGGGGRPQRSCQVAQKWTGNQTVSQVSKLPLFYPACIVDSTKFTVNLWYLKRKCVSVTSRFPKLHFWCFVMGLTLCCIQQKRIYSHSKETSRSWDVNWDTHQLSQIKQASQLAVLSPQISLKSRELLSWSLGVNGTLTA